MVHLLVLPDGISATILLLARFLGFLTKAQRESFVVMVCFIHLMLPVQTQSMARLIPFSRLLTMCIFGREFLNLAYTPPDVNVIGCGLDGAAAAVDGVGLGSIK